ncbi:MAG: MDR family MFS transporter [Bacteroidota bacterium]
MIQRASQIFHEYPRTFWFMILVNFIDRLGGSLLFPFFALYLTRRFGIGMTQVGVLFAVFSISSFIGSFPGGALTDRFGRKKIIIFSLLATSISTLFMGWADSFQIFVLIGFVSGIFTDVGGPAYEAVFMDVLPEEKRPSGFGIRRVAFNLAIVAGPAIGGFIAARSYLALFVLDAIISGLVALLVVLLIPETKPAQAEGTKPETTVESFAGYLRVLRDARFMAFVGASLLAWLVYMNLNTTLGVFLRNQHGVPEAGYGWLISINAAMVVLLQFPITRRTEKLPPMLMMALGTLLIAGGLALYGFVGTYGLFVVAMAVLTIGEMVAIPISNAVVASFAAEEMRGRYSFIYGLSWGIAFGVGPYLAGLILDHYNPDLLWIACGLVGILDGLIFVLLHLWAQTRPTAQTAQG